AKVHVRCIGHGGDVLRESEAGRDAVIGVVGRNPKHVVPDFILRYLMLYRFLGKNEPDAGAIFHVQAVMVAVVNLELQIGTGGNSKRVSWRPNLRHVTGQINRGDDIQVARRVTRDSTAVGSRATVVNDRRGRPDMQHFASAKMEV